MEQIVTSFQAQISRPLFFFIIICTIRLPLSAQTDTTLLLKHLQFLTKTDTARSYDHPATLNRCAYYIYNYFKLYSDSVTFQAYTVKGIVYKNVICSFGTQFQKRIIIGAHYDVCGHLPGADDNASGVSGLLELARLLKNEPMHQRIDLVAYTLEEPPYFETEWMGSYIHAKSLADKHIPVIGMMSLEMIGYFKDAKNSQQYPWKPLSLIYGKKGNYITLVKKFGSGQFARRFSRRFKHQGNIDTKRFTGPASLGVDLSDHMNYWNFGFSALMITDTSFYRNKNYHKPTDTIETLDLKRMAKVIDSVLRTITRF